jgi:hypothetical protein
MRGYIYITKEQEALINEKPTLEITLVGCRNCSNEWKEEYSFYKNTPRINGLMRIYDYCDNCKSDADLKNGFLESMR